MLSRSTTTVLALLFSAASANAQLSQRQLETGEGLQAPFELQFQPRLPPELIGNPRPSAFVKDLSSALDSLPLGVGYRPALLSQRRELAPKRRAEGSWAAPFPDELEDFLRALDEERPLAPSPHGLLRAAARAGAKSGQARPVSAALPDALEEALGSGGQDAGRDVIDESEQRKSP